VVTDPGKMEIPKISLPERYFVDDCMVLKPGFDRQVVKGPGIKDLPRFPGMKDDLQGVAAIKVGDKITTDHIMPAGARLKFRSNIQKYASFAFEQLEPGFAEKALASKAKGRDNFIIAGASYGQGSSREHAALCPAYLGVKAVVARSIERIHRANLVNFGIIPFCFVDEKDYGRIAQGDALEIQGVRAALSGGKEIWLLDRTNDAKILLAHDLTGNEIQTLLKGGKLNKSTEP
jgi:aconitate hydratase